ncbi:MAG: glutamate synthase [Verrucomicrobiota bacterium]|nr:glutamate synthase [Verrucomicrobiota bacterium]
MTSRSTETLARRLLAARASLPTGPSVPRRKADEEGGCGVVGFAAGVPVSGRNIFEPSARMHNRGNGKGGGIAVAAMEPRRLGVDAETLRQDYLLQVALLDPKAEKEMERTFVAPFFRVDHKVKIRPAAHYREVGLEVKPPDVVRYFARVKPVELARFVMENNLGKAPERWVEDEYVCRNSFRLNTRFYASLGEKRAFVLSHARDLMIFKIVGYAEQVVQYYGLEDLRARVWIAHQRYPTKGRVWHPGGAHPFIGMNEALVHNGDFANYFSICEYLRQHNMTPLFLTDTEVAALLFDLWTRVYRYPLEYVIEALAPTTEMDFDRLPDNKKRVYRAIQAAHMHGSPDGPWFFIIARSDPDNAKYQLLGITDTAMLRPQVFALQEGDVSIGVIASEKQAIDAILRSLNREDPRFRQVADRYWNARGGSHTDGGAFAFTVTGTNGVRAVECADKFGRIIRAPTGDWRVNWKRAPQPAAAASREAGRALKAGNLDAAFAAATRAIAEGGADDARWIALEAVRRAGEGGAAFDNGLALLTRLNDLHYDCGPLRRSAVIEIARRGIDALLDGAPAIGAKGRSSVRRIEWRARNSLRAPKAGETTLIINAEAFPAEGDDCDARLAVRAYRLGWKHLIVYRLRGQRFTGCGLGPGSDGARIDVYGSSGDYLASGIDGLEIHAHDNGQDQLGQIMKRGRLVVYGDVGQAFMYGAKGGDVYVMGNAAGRPLINAAGRPRVVINGTCLDFLAESFMAGDPYDRGGFVVLNGVEFDDCGRVRSQESPYPGGNLFSLASGGAIYARDPHRLIQPQQLNGGEFADFTEDDWALILPYLQANERYFGISIERDLLTIEGVRRAPADVYRRVRAVSLAVLAKQEVPE